MLVKLNRLSISIKVDGRMGRSCKETLNISYFLVLHCKQPARDLGEAPTNLSLLKVPGRLWAVSNCELFERLVLLIPLLLIPKSSSVIFILRGPWERW